MAEDERRKHRRADIDVAIRVKSASVEDFVDRYIRDISSGGVFIEHDEPMKVGTELSFELQIEDDAPLISGRGRVAWRRLKRTESRPPGMGVEFRSLSAESRSLVDVFLEQRDPDPGRFDKKR